MIAQGTTAGAPALGASTSTAAELLLSCDLHCATLPLNVAWELWSRVATAVVGRLIILSPTTLSVVSLYRAWKIYSEWEKKVFIHAWHNFNNGRYSRQFGLQTFNREKNWTSNFPILINFPACETFSKGIYIPHPSKLPRKPEAVNREPVIR